MIKLSYHLIYILFSIAFFQGLLATFGISEALTRIAMNLIVLVLFLVGLIYIIKKRSMNFIAFDAFMLLLVIMLVSFLISDVSLLHLVFFIKVFILPFLFLLALLNIPFSQEQREKILKFIMILFFLQIIAAVIKVSLVGFTERYVGSVGIEGGSLAAIIPLMAISYIFSYYLYHSDNKKILLLIPVFIFFAISCSKLGVIIHLAILLIFLYFIYEENSFFSFKTFIFTVMFAIFGFLTIYTFITMTPRANPDGIVGGEVDFEYALVFAETYTSRENTETRLVGVARKDAPAAVFNIMSQKGLSTLLFGLGPGEIIMSSFLPYDNPMEEKYNLGYGARLGFLWTSMQIGILGSLAFLYFHLILFSRVYKKYRMSTDKEYKVILLGTIGLSIIFLIDYFTYSDSVVYQPSVVFTYLYMFSMILLYKDKSNYE